MTKVDQPIEYFTKINELLLMQVRRIIGAPIALDILEYCILAIEPDTNAVKFDVSAGQFFSDMCGCHIDTSRKALKALINIGCLERLGHRKLRMNPHLANKKGPDGVFEWTGRPLVPDETTRRIAAQLEINHPNRFVRRGKAKKPDDD